MSVISISRNTQNNVCIVSMISTDNLATVGSSNYIYNQMNNIRNLNNGFWQWYSTDMILCAASDGNAFFEFTDSTFNTVVQYGTEPGVYVPIAGGTMTGPLILSGNATNPLGAVTLQQLAASGVTIWQTDTVTPINLVVDTGHFANCGTLLTYVLPPVSIVGNMVRIAWQNAAGWKISQGAGQQIIYGNTQTTLGTGGSLASSMQGDCVELVCQVANTVWEVLTSQGNLTVV